MTGKIEYPKMLYKDGESRVVKNADERLQLGDGWSESPVAEKVTIDAAAPVAVEVPPAKKRKSFLS